MDKRQEDKERKERSDKRGVYVAPKLKVFGPVGVLTQSDSTGGTEGQGGFGAKKP